MASNSRPVLKTRDLAFFLLNQAVELNPQLSACEAKQSSKRGNVKNGSHDLEAINKNVVLNRDED